MTLVDFILLLGGLPRLFTTGAEPGWGRPLALLAVAAGFFAVRVAAHRSPRSPFRLNRRDPFQWAELAFFLLLALLAGRGC